ncbi:MAG TPA: hypothetical protein VMA97_05335 [Streptosporangiaceae bacterium]|nr:hypothetical protein [Streptosporangiaceae bacterium]
MHVLLEEDLGRLRMQRVRPWHLLLARGRAARLDRELAGGASPEASASLATRAMQLTSSEFRRDLATALRRILVMAGAPAPPVTAHAPLHAARPPSVPLRTARISRSAPVLAELASRLLEPGPVPVRGVAMVTQLLADGTGPLYREAARDDLSAVATRAVQALTW